MVYIGVTLILTFDPDFQLQSGFVSKGFMFFFGFLSMFLGQDLASLDFFVALKLFLCLSNLCDMFNRPNCGLQDHED